MVTTTAPNELAIGTISSNRRMSASAMAGQNAAAQSPADDMRLSAASVNRSHGAVLTRPDLAPLAPWADAAILWTAPFARL